MTILKEHVSYSEVRQWKECPWRHKLLYIDKLSTFEESPHLHYGTIIHDACEHYLKTKELKIKEAQSKIKSAWDEHGFDAEDFIQLQTQRAELQGWKYKHNKLKDWMQWAETSIKSVPQFLDETFPGWQVVSAEEAIYENMENIPTKFKGYIDCIIKVPNKDKYKYWVLDWKTSSGRGWSLDKQRDFNTQAQVILYKHFWGTKHNIPMKDIQCGFVLLKKVKTVGKSCQLIKVSAGPKNLEKSRKMVRSMIKTVEKQFYLKNKNSCMFCEFKNTIHCK
tara:strand:+ start:1071 stop:1904 length:834 start_codon:yes stop_codon:yes gene_type:complete